MSDLLPLLTAALADRYRVERELGAGGMATVYLAEDLRHRRRVAIKVLHPELSAVIGPERFLKEIETTAGLQHPHILPLFDSGEAAGQLFYVMPFVEGETLRARLERERQLPMEDALLIAREVGDALAHAHGRGVVHRDIKPENILLQGGHALVADFGIALAVASAGGPRMTQTGMSLGTPHYMSPEQAMGERAVDARSDQYALAAVLYELLVGTPPFTGANAQAIVAKVLTAPAPSARGERRSVPLAVDAALARALAKLPADRFASVSAFTQALAVPMASAVGVPAAAPTLRRRWMPVTVAGMAGVALGVSAVALRGGRATSPQSSAPIVRLEVPEPAGITGSTTVLGDLLPDGSAMVYIGDGPAGHGLFVQPFTDTTARFLPFPEAAVGSAPVADGSALLTFSFTRDGLSRMNLVPLNGGPIRPLSDSVRFGLVLDDQGRLYGSHHATGAFVRVENDGQRLTYLARPMAAQGEMAYRVPLRVGADGWLVHVMYRDGRPNQIAAVDVDQGTVRPLTPGYASRLVAPGVLVYALDGVVMAARLDERSLTLRGVPVPAWRDPGIRGFSLVGSSRNGSLLYGRRAFGGWAVLQVDGARTDTVVAGGGAPPTRVVAHPAQPRLALEFPDALEIREPGTGVRRTALPAGSGVLQWTPDGGGLVLLRTQGRAIRQNESGITPLRGRLTRVAGDLSGAPTPFTLPGGEADTGTVLLAVGSGGWVEETSQRRLRFHGAAGGAPVDLGPGRAPSLSPDGALVAFQDYDDASGTRVVVAAVPPRAGRWEVGPGSAPQWSRDGRWLYFAGPQRPYSAVPSAISRVAVSTASGFAASPPQRVADPPAHATLSWTLGARDGAVYWITSRERNQPILITNFARLADSLLTAAGVPR